MNLKQALHPAVETIGVLTFDRLSDDGRTARFKRLSDGSYAEYTIKMLRDCETDGRITVDEVAGTIKWNSDKFAKATYTT